MKPFTRFTTALVLGGAMLALAGASQAQPSQQGGGYGPQQPDLHALLHLHPEQEAAWQAYKAGQQPQPGEMQAVQLNPQQLGAMTTPHRLDRIEALLNAQISIFHRQATATRNFYAVLTPDQKRTFDQVTAPPSRGAPPQR